MSFKGWLVFIVISIVVFCFFILPMTANAALVLMYLGMGDSAMPVAFVIAAAIIIGCIIRAAVE